jgi:ligand-binding sensor domain-containing protein/two-component sensor histidine kinase
MLYCGPVSAQSTYATRLMTVQQGLTDRTVLRIEQDRNGLMWLLTTSGLSSYDGYEYVHYGSAGSGPYAFFRIEFDKHGDLYLLENSGTIFRKTSGGFAEIKYDIPDSAGVIFDFTFDDKNQLWAVPRKGHSIYVFNEERELIQEIPFWTSDDRILYDMRYKRFLRKAGNDKSVYVHTGRLEVTRFNSDFKFLNSYVIPDSLAQCDYMYDFFPTSDSAAWLFCPTQSVYGITADTKIRRVIDQPGFRAGFLPLYIDRSGNKLYFSAYRNEIIVVNLHTSAVDTIRLDLEGYPDVATDFSINEDAIGDIWVTGEIGVHVISEKSDFFDVYDVDGVRGQSQPGLGIRSINQSEDGAIYFSTDHFAFNRLNPVTSEIVTIGGDIAGPQPYPSFHHGVTLRDNSLYSVNGLRLDLGTGEIDQVSPNRAELHVAFDQREMFYTLGNRGLFVFEEFGGIPVDSVDIPWKILNLIVSPYDHKWICTQWGLLLYDDDARQLTVRYSKSSEALTAMPETQRSVEGLKSSYVNDVAMTDAHTAWIATTAGMSLLDLNTDEITNFESPSELADRVIYSILPEGDSALWLGTGNGLLRYNIRSNDVMTFTTDQGLPHNEFNRNAKLISKEDYYYMGGIDGICRFKPEDILSRQKSSAQIPFGIENVAVFDGVQAHILPGDSIIRQGIFTISPRDRSVNFDLLLADYQAPNLNEFSWYLEDLDTDWGAPTSKRNVTYRNLPPGEYVFHARGRGPDKVWSANEVALQLVVKPKFTQTMWFLLLIILITALIIYSITRYRYMQRLKLERLRTRISSDLHDEVGGVLSGIAMQMDLLRSDVPVSLRHRMERISNSSRAAASKMRDVIWSVDASRDTFEDLLERMKAYVNEILVPVGITWKFHVDEAPQPEARVSSAVRQNIYLIFKEAITNAAKHSGASHVVIEISSHGRKGLYLEINDDGKGFDPESIRKGDGLRNMRRRGQAIQSELTLNSENGTSWVLEVTDLEAG